MFIAIVSNTNLDIEDIYQSYQPKQNEYGGPWGRSELYTHIVVPQGLTKDNIKVIRENDALYIVEDEQKTQALSLLQWNKLRQQRNDLLKNTDWSQLPDIELDQEAREKYKKYRKALRDLPANTIDPFNPIWPNLE